MNHDCWVLTSILFKSMHFVVEQMSLSLVLIQREVILDASINTRDALMIVGIKHIREHM